MRRVRRVVVSAVLGLAVGVVGTVAWAESPVNPLDFFSTFRGGFAGAAPAAPPGALVTAPTPPMTAMPWGAMSNPMAWAQSPMMWMMNPLMMSPMMMAPMAMTPMTAGMMAPMGMMAPTGMMGGAFANPMLAFTTPGNWVNPQSYLAFLQPGAWAAMMNPYSYLAFMNPSTYLPLMDPYSHMSTLGGAPAPAPSFGQPAMPMPMPWMPWPPR